MTQTCGSCRSCDPCPPDSENAGRGLCRNTPPTAFREVVQAGEQVKIFVHGHYPYVYLADAGCSQYRPALGRISRALTAAWRFVVSL